MARRATLAYAAAIVGMAGLPAGLGPAPAAAQPGGFGGGLTGPPGALLQNFPGVRFHHAAGRIKAVYGIPMTAGTTAAAAAESWITKYAAVFGQASPHLVLHSSITTASGKTIRSYRQVIDGLPVEGSMLTVVTSPQPQPRVVYAAARMALRPPGGLANPMISPAQALAIAQTHPAAAGLVSWAEPETAAVYDEFPAPYGRRVYKCRGSGPDPVSLTIYVDAVLGQVVRVIDNVAAADVSGTVTGHRSPGVRPDTWGQAGGPVFGTLACPNGPADLGALSQVRVTAFVPGTNVPVASAFTDLNGAFTIPLTPGSPVDVRAELVGPYWRIRDGSNGHLPGVEPFCCELPVPVCCGGTTTCCHTVGLSQPFAANPVPTTAAGVGIVFNSSPTEFRTAQINALEQIERTNRFFSERIKGDQYIPGLHNVVNVVVNYTHPTYGQGAFANEAFSTIWMGPSFFPAASFTGSGPNKAFSTVLSHEYGHYLLYWMRNIPRSDQHRAFHEGVADCLALLVHDTNVIGSDWNGCGTALRSPALSTAIYPDCAHVSGLDDAYTHSMMLSRLWLEVGSSIETSEASRQLFVDWLLLTEGGQDIEGVCPCIDPHPPSKCFGRALHPDLAVEMLIADDDDGIIANGTPHYCGIRQAFEDRGVPWPGGLPVCGSGPGTPQCAADCDGSGAPDAPDFPCFMGRLLAGSVAADCNGDGQLNVADMAAFQSAWAAMHGAPSAAAIAR